MASTGLVLIMLAAMATCMVEGKPPPPLRIANIYGSHMVLQRAPAKANIWGYVTKCDSKITATFNGKKFTPATFIDTKGQCVWVLTLLPMKADPVKTYTISVTSDKYGSAQISDVMFGDVWVCSGQSNMEFTVPQAFNADDEIEAAANYPLIRVFTAADKTATTPQSELIEVLQPWSIASPKSVGGGNWTYFSATCWFFGRDIFKYLKYPIGLVATDWGGTPIEAWSSPDALKMCKKELQGSPNLIKVGGPGDPSVLWNAMIHPFLNMTIKGAIWYQGEANAGSNAISYNCTFPAMIDDWRAKWHQGSKNQTTPLFFGFVQLAPTGTSNATVGGFPIIRWAQTAGYGYTPNKRMENVFMAVAIDLGDPKSPFGSVHPRDKQDVGTRLSLGARAMVYNDSEVYYLGMLPQKALVSTASGGVLTITVTFGPANSKGKLELRYPYGFELGCGTTSGKTTSWIEGTAKSVTGNDVNVEFPPCPLLLKAVQIRYCWRTDPCSFSKCPIYSSAVNTSPPFIMDL